MSKYRKALHEHSNYGLMAESRTGELNISPGPGIRDPPYFSLSPGTYQVFTVKIKQNLTPAWGRGKEKSVTWW